MRTSDSIAKMAPDVVKAHSEMKEVERNAVSKVVLKSGASYENEYADLEAVLAVTRPILAANKLALIQFPAYKDGAVYVTSRLLHDSGEWMEDDSSAGALDPDPQKAGAAITYLRRYAVMAICGMAPKDDDANPGRNKKKRGQVQPATGAQTEKSMEAVVRGMPIKITAKFQRLKISNWTERYRLYKACDGDTEKLSLLLDKKMAQDQG